MYKKMFVGNLSYVTSENEVRKAFEQYGFVGSVRVITDRETGRSKGFGFVEMEADDASKAIGALNGTQLQGRTIMVNEARPLERSAAGHGASRSEMSHRSRY